MYLLFIIENTCTAVFESGKEKENLSTICYNDFILSSLECLNAESVTNHIKVIFYVYLSFNILFFKKILKYFTVGYNFFYIPI